jgi:WD repeat-containing protein 45
MKFRTCLQGLIPLPSYFSSEWSFAQFRLMEPGKAYVGFQGDEDKLFVVTENGGFFRLKWNCAAGGAMEQELYEKFDDKGALPDS